MKKYIKTKLRSKLTEADFVGSPDVKWDMLEQDVKTAIIPIIEKNKENFGSDSYAVIDAIQQIFDGMFQKR